MQAKVECDKGLGVSPTGLAVFLDFSSAIERYGNAEANTQGPDNASPEEIKAMGTKVVEEDKYGNLFEMYEKIAGENPYIYPMKIYQRCITRWADCGLTTT